VKGTDLFATTESIIYPGKHYDKRPFETVFPDRAVLDLLADYRPDILQVCCKQEPEKPSIMQFVAVTKDNITPYVTLRREIAGEEEQQQFQTTDLAAAILDKGEEYALLDDDGVMQAAVSIRNGNALVNDRCIMISVEARDKTPKTEFRMLCKVLATTAQDIVESDTLYRVYDPIGSAFPKTDMMEIGFCENVASFRYERKPGPPQPGEFPHADRATRRGYRSVLIDDDYVASDPDIFDKLADIYNRAFSGCDLVRPTTPERMRKSYDTEANKTIIAKLGDEVTGSIMLTNLGSYVLSPQYYSLRRHWGTGSVDLMCRHTAEFVAEHWNLPIVGYAEATNAASWKALERFGLSRVAEYCVWERKVPAGERLTV